MAEHLGCEFNQAIKSYSKSLRFFPTLPTRATLNYVASVADAGFKNILLFPHPEIAIRIPFA